MGTALQLLCPRCDRTTPISALERPLSIHQVYLLGAVNAFFVFLLFIAFSVTGSLTDLNGFEVFWLPSFRCGLCRAVPFAVSLACFRSFPGGPDIIWPLWQWFSEMLWMSWGQLSGKAPKARDPDGSLWPTRLVRTFAAFAGMFAFSLIVGFIKSALKARLKALKLGKGRVYEDGFSMIIGWNDRMLPLVEQLILANESAGGGMG